MQLVHSEAHVRPSHARSTQNVLKDLVLTLQSLFGACVDWLILRTPFGRLIRKQQTFAFLVHPRTDEFVYEDVYGNNDIFRPFPAFPHLFKIVSRDRALRFIRGFARRIVPIKLSRITVKVQGRTYRGTLLSTVRTPQLILEGSPEGRREHLNDLFRLASRRGAARVGLGALLPSMTQYGRRFADPRTTRPAVSTGHAYTAYVIAEFLEFFTSRRNRDGIPARVAIVGAAGSTGKALIRTLKKTWIERVPLDLSFVDVPAKERMLEMLVHEVAGSLSASAATDLRVLQDVEYVVVVTNARGAIVRPEHVLPGTVIIDDSQPRNTTPALVEHGCFVIDVLARVNGLDCNFDFGFQTDDPSVTFTCLAETVLATITGDRADLAVGEVTDDVVSRVCEIAREGEALGLIGDLPFFSFGRELSSAELERACRPLRPAKAIA